MKYLTISSNSTSQTTSMDYKIRDLTGYAALCDLKELQGLRIENGLSEVTIYTKRTFSSFSSASAFRFDFNYFFNEFTDFHQVSRNDLHKTRTD